MTLGSAIRRVNGLPSRSAAGLRATLRDTATAVRRRPLTALAGLLPGVYALILGFNQLSRVRSARLDPDVRAFMSIARNMTPTTVINGFREPVWPAILAVPVKLLGPHPLIPRLLGIAGFVLLVVAFQRLVTRLYSRAWGIVAALLLAASPWLAFQSARGLREEASAALVLLFVTAVIGGTGGRRLVLLAAGAAVIAMLRWDSVLLTVPTLVIAGIMHRPRVRHALLAASVFAGVVAPMLIVANRRYGDPFFFSNTLGAVYFRNIEFGGKPGFPTRAELRRNSYAGERITWFDYFFHLHTVGEMTRRAVKGAASIPLTVTDYGLFYPRFHRVEAQWPTLALMFSLSTLLPWLVVGAGVVGSVLLLRRRGTWPLPLMLVASILTFAPIARMVDIRLLLPTLPLLAIGAIECLHAGLRRRARGRCRPEATAATGKRVPHAGGAPVADRDEALTGSR